MNNLRSLALAAAVLAVHAMTAQAQQILSREEAMKYAFLVANNEPAPSQAPIKVDADLKRPFGGYEDEYGVLVLPETKLSASVFASLGKDVVPVGQLWLRKLTPQVQGSAVESSSLQMVPISHEGESVRVPLCLMGARKSASGSLELLVYGKGKEPLMCVPLTKGQSSQSLPLELSGERESDGGLITLRVVGQYVAKIPVTELAE